MSDGPSAYGYTDPSFPPPDLDAGDASIIIYGYTPNFVLCILGLVLFTLASLLHGIQVIIYRLWSFTPLTVSCILEVVGYAFRSLSARKNPYRVTYFVVQYFMIVTAPVLVSASIYVCPTRLMSWAAAAGTSFGNCWFMRRKFILWFFISVDVVTTIIQVAGAAMIGAAESNGKDSTTANNILLSGLAIQCAAFLVFLALFSVIIGKIFKNSLLEEKMKERRSPFIFVLALASVLVFMRTLFRLIETSEGVYGYLSTHEAYFGGLEFAPMVIAVWQLALWHPDRWPTNFKREARKTNSV
ncbi:RTA1 like protein-domain-containing protein [Bisporella sp. PMI_857]|nr:RTA1 like protein-domain-containing protein [Bisporella sp. PMI_857]